MTEGRDRDVRGILTPGAAVLLPGFRLVEAPQASAAAVQLGNSKLLGIEVKGDGGLLFGLALLAFGGSVGVLLLRRSQLPLARYLGFA